MCASSDKLRKQVIKSKSEFLFHTYKQMEDKVNKVSIDRKRDCFTNKICFHKGDIKSTWKTGNLVPNKNKKPGKLRLSMLMGKILKQ